MMFKVKVLSEGGFVLSCEKWLNATVYRLSTRCPRFPTHPYKIWLKKKVILLLYCISVLNNSKMFLAPQTAAGSTTFLCYRYIFKFKLNFGLEQINLR